ncbi:hypothetical protein PV325_005121 [Microctonus aethiopoides]|uniref:Gamma-secretase subunit Aph-1 n=1 Tax=Microctonus aethiopoides TaxID=144406 RepID=A0AA39FKM7_9HYME|nr:hypothetical protein PV325_005121 [Microctonus aethiopoides]KAK0099118.1 hypothetical protein PV326_006582 [Microctonus aethiopoides]KAK0171359.1 hypothetical protein PV328_009100 [Microctonus aethiopoides]
MTILDFFGCAFLAFGTPLSMFALTVCVEPMRVIILVASAFYWLIALLLSSILWYVVKSLQPHIAIGLIFSVLFQEVFRYLLHMLLRNAERGLEKITPVHLADRRHIFAYVCGLGFGLMSGAFAFVNVLADAVGPGTMGLRQGTEYFFILSAATTLCFILLHTFWGVIFFSAIDQKNWGQIGWVVCTHLFVSCMTLLNKYECYAAPLLSSYIVLLLTAALAFKVAGGKLDNIRLCLPYRI